MEKKHILLLLVLLVIGAFLRLYKLGDVPGGLNQDEAAWAYSSYTLLNWGKDYEGNSFPMHLTSFNSGQCPMIAYLAMPFIALFDLNTFSIRLFPALFNIACLFIFFLLARKIAGDKFAFISLFLLAISPWHILLSRWSLETTLLPGTILISTLLFIQAQNKKVALFVPCSVLCLSVYVYTPAFLFAPVFFLFYFIYAIYKKYFKLKQWVVAIICNVIIVIPFALFIIVNKYDLQTITIGFFTIPKLPVGFAYHSGMSDLGFSVWIENIKRLFDVLLNGKDGLPWNSVDGVHNLYYLSIPLFVYGLAKGVYDFFKNKIEVLFPMLLWLLLAIVSATLISSNINRICLIYIPIIFFVAYGFSDILKNMRGFAYTLIVLYCISFLHFNSIYYGKWAEQMKEHFFYSYLEAIKYATKNTEPNDDIYLTTHVNQSYIHVLIATKYNLQDFLATANIPNKNTAIFHSVKSFGRFKFGVNGESWRRGKAVIVKNNEAKCPDDGQWNAKKFENYTVCLRKYYE